MTYKIFPLPMLAQTYSDALLRNLFIGCLSSFPTITPYFCRSFSERHPDNFACPLGNLAGQQCAAGPSSNPKTKEMSPEASVFTPP
ncbi:hypothetical protein CEXT_741711 [Caerostris extrusa]|uniref:Uncharacterized protein n=1 Tax=Caerostris extrusa TaxID=172846 RepID=A0AAV4NMZ5_CAEEX|nr:hypothetical protein CEXT_741711 [Caerostris extrusa]